MYEEILKLLEGKTHLIKEELYVKYSDIVKIIYSKKDNTVEEFQTEDMLKEIQEMIDKISQFTYNCGECEDE